MYKSVVEFQSSGVRADVGVHDVGQPQCVRALHQEGHRPSQEVQSALRLPHRVHHERLHQHAGAV
jgi:hypothetical protein